MKKKQKKESVFEAMVNHNYRPHQKRMQREREQVTEDNYKWVQTEGNEWKRVTDDSLDSLSEPFIEDKEPFTEVQRGLNSDYLNGQKRVWKVKANRKALENRYGMQRTGVSVGVTVFAFGGTLLDFDLRIQAILYLIWAATILVADPVQAIGRFLAIPCRVMLTGCCLTLILLLCKPCFNLVTINVAAILMTVFCIRHLNDKWVSADNWQNTRAVQKAIEQDPNDLAGKNWQADGCREVKTALAEMGIATDTDSLDTIHKTAFIIGYEHGLVKTGQIKATEKKLKQAKEEAENFREQCITLENELRSAQFDKEKIVTNLQRECAELRAENEKILRVNDELVQSFGDEETEEKNKNVVEINGSGSGKTVKEKVLYARYELNYSYADCGRYAGCCKATAYNIVKEAEDKAKTA